MFLAHIWIQTASRFRWQTTFTTSAA